MLFAATGEWQETNPVIQAVNAPFNLYYAIELMAHRIFYILKIETQAEEGFILPREFFIDGYSKVCKVMNYVKADKHQLSIYVPGSFSENGESSIHIVKKIYRAKNNEFGYILIYECLDKTINNIGPDEMPQLSKKDLKCIYPRKNHGSKQKEPTDC